MDKIKKIVLGVMCIACIEDSSASKIDGGGDVKYSKIDDNFCDLYTAVFPSIGAAAARVTEVLDEEGFDGDDIGKTTTPKKRRITEGCLSAWSDSLVEDDVESILVEFLPDTDKNKLVAGREGDFNFRTSTSIFKSLFRMIYHPTADVLKVLYHRSLPAAAYLSLSSHSLNIALKIEKINQYVMVKYACSQSVKTEEENALKTVEKVLKSVKARARIAYKGLTITEDKISPLYQLKSDARLVINNASEKQSEVFTEFAALLCQEVQKSDNETYKERAEQARKQLAAWVVMYIVLGK